MIGTAPNTNISYNVQINRGAAVRSYTIQKPGETSSAISRALPSAKSAFTATASALTVHSNPNNSGANAAAAPTIARRLSPEKGRTSFGNHFQSSDEPPPKLVAVRPANRLTNRLGNGDIRAPETLGSTDPAPFLTSRKRIYNIVTSTPPQGTASFDQQTPVINGYFCYINF